MARAIFYTSIAVLFDGVQIVLQFGFLLIGIAGIASIGASAGAGAASETCKKTIPLVGNAIANSCAHLGALVGSAVGTALSPALIPIFVPIAVFIGFIVNIGVSICIGAVFLTMLATNDMFYIEYVIPVGVVKVMPFFLLLPGWTALAILSVLKKNAGIGATEVIKITARAVAAAGVAAETGPGAIGAAAVSVGKSVATDVAKNAVKNRVDGIVAHSQIPTQESRGQIQKSTA